MVHQPRLPTLLSGRNLAGTPWPEDARARRVHQEFDDVFARELISVSLRRDFHDEPVGQQPTVTEVPKLAACLHLFCALQWLTNSGRKVWLQSYVRVLRGDIGAYF